MEGKIALITGAARGIGYAIAEAFTKHGATVAAADLDDTHTPFAMTLKMDVTSETDVDDGVAKIIDTYGRIDILVSNAGIQTISPVHELALADWRRMLAVHLDGAFLTTRACLPHMYAQQSGAIIYVGSVHSKTASKLKAPYVTAKHGLLGLCRTVAKEAAEHNVRANVICPGFVRTPLVERQIPEQAAALNLTEDEVIKTVMLGQTADGLFTTLDDVAQATLFLANFQTNALTGQSLLVTHGWQMD